MGAVFTTGQNQTILNQSLVPFTMISSTVLLGTAFSRYQLVGAMIILMGAFIAISPTLFKHDDSGAEENPQWMANLLYLSSNIPMALSAVYKESRFAQDDIHPLYLSQWVSIYQFLFGFVLAPLQLIPGISTPQV
jgi:drug/metabolite transporter (DMT)-like permease